MKINDLNIIAQRLGAFGKEHLGIDRQGHTVPTTSSLGGRIASWIRSRHSDTAAQANRDVMTGIINTIRQTDDLGDRFAAIARKSLESRLAAGRPLSGRDAARVLQDVIRLKTTEDQARLETRLLNVRDQFQKLCAPHADGSPSDLETQMAARRQRFGLPPATAEQLQGYRETALRDLEARARRADHSLTPAESLDALGESIRMKTLQEAKAGITAMAEQVSGEGPSGFMARLGAAMQTKGLAGDISPATRDALVQTIHEKLTARCLYDSNNIHQPTLAEAATVADKVISNFVAALDTVEHAQAMPREAKRILQDEILHSSKPVNAAMAQAICDAVLDTGQFLRSLTLAEATPAGLKRDFDAYARTMHAATTLSDGTLRPGIDGGPEAGLVRILTARAACRMLGLGNLEPLSKEERKLVRQLEKENQPVPPELAARINARIDADYAARRALGGGSPLHALRRELAQEADANLRSRNELLLMNVLDTLVQATESEEFYDLLDLAPGLGQMRMAEARRFVPQGLGLTPPEGQTFDMAAARQKMQDGLNATVRSTPPGNGAAALSRQDLASPELIRKCNCFSDQFIKDFARSGITINGHRFGGGGLSLKPQLLERELDALIATFPSIEEAGRVCSPLHQASGADILMLLMADPVTAGEAVRINTLQGKSLANSLPIEIIRHTDGSHHVNIEFCFQKVDEGLGPRASSGINVRASFLLPNGREPLQFRIEDLDVLFNTRQG
ncbi:MAG: hypothetical protein SOZ39_08615 [Desulfovibrio piger]|uniref:hypothetical protein n=1 Tax=Desulfovibrio piger TaxID=901 RepID=UPI0024301A52|nr:hypothetical protein [Desulfovibrio piger]MDY3881178.1 hypothetical protein [Desulfovibrio piger]